MMIASTLPFARRALFSARPSIAASFGIVRPAAACAAFKLSPIQRLAFSNTPANQSGQGIPTLEIDALKRSKELKRPISPHLSIYQPQLTWVMSGLHRVTAVAVGGVFYLFAMTYAIAPFSSASVAASVAALPFAVKFLGKAAIVFPTVYHSLNGIRHLVWDSVTALTLTGVYQTGYTVIAATVLVSTILCLL
ncbi:succinate dehydrogenase cytochrome B subunit, mitochondrial [Zopfochytrium polystomum]|nr:succinate dehydrogenase cytochrome B subunit, mitochondrial [Zopfochytrium polystomum]